ncbi:hypothetical protein INT44_005911 [Umbelopsis vinacea]|uniref:5'-nucleotidase n=1 Tax=Umbelopsis vinacea TaxID=44442 RepID=A0A8H7UH66_9FUNG|nr:hypothetical protein INT44_005911 [Umbelopsis vinacea]
MSPAEVNEGVELVHNLLLNPSVKIANIEAVASKLQKILSHGKDEAHFICDFDMTLSRHWVKGADGKPVRNSSTHGVLGRYKRLSPEFHTETQRLYNHYYPIEIDQTLTFEEKVPEMVAWWTQAHEILIGQSITKEDIALMVKQTYVEMRPKADLFLKKCADINIPLLVFSAGVGDVIQEALNQHNMFYHNMHIVSNKMGWNDRGICDHFEEPLIHVFNKSEFCLDKTDYYQTIKDRKNVILLGDSVGDVLMSQGVQHDTCLNIGFLNHDVEALYPKYSQLYDIVIIGDSSVEPVLSILEKLQ